MGKFTKSNHAILKYGSGSNTEVDFESNQSMAGSKITGALDADHSHDYVTKQQLDTHNHDTVYEPDHTHTTWTPHTHPYSLIDHDHNSWPGNYTYNGSQKLPNGLYYMWGMTAAYDMSTTACSNATGWTKWRWIPVTFHTLIGAGSPGFPTSCYSVSLTVINGEGTLPYSSTGPHPKILYHNADHRQVDNVQAGIYNMSNIGFTAEAARMLTDPGYTYNYDMITYDNYWARGVDGTNTDNSTRKIALMWLAIGK